MLIYPAKNRWWRAQVTERDDGVEVIFEQKAVSESRRGTQVWARKDHAVFAAPFHLVCSNISTLLNEMEDRNPHLRIVK